MVRTQDFHSWNTSSILVESTIKQSPVTTGMSINLKRFKTMVKNAKTAATKGRETKLGKKTSEELIEIILRKDKTERNLNKQIVSLKSEVNELSIKVNNFNKDMEGTIQTLESYKDKVKTLNEKNDAITLEYKDTQSLFAEENQRAITLENKLNMWKVATYAMLIITIAAVVAAIL